MLNLFRYGNYSFVDYLTYWLSYYLFLFLILFLILYILSSWLLYKLALKYKEKEEFLMYLVPVYKFYRLIQFTSANPVILFVIYADLLCVPFFFVNDFAFYLCWLVSSAGMGLFWGHVAKSMVGSKDYLLLGIVYGLASALKITALVPYAVFALNKDKPSSSYANGVALLRPRTLADGLAGLGKSVQSGAFSKRKPYAGESTTSSPERTISGYTSAGVSLYCVEGRLAGLSVPITSSAFLIGRDPQSAHLIIDSQDVSRRHVNVSLLSGGFVMLEDLNSSNGTYLLKGEVKERVNGAVKLKAGDRFTIGYGDNIFEIR